MLQLVDQELDFLDCWELQRAQSCSIVLLNDALDEVVIWYSQGYTLESRKETLVAGRCLFGLDSEDRHLGVEREESWLEDMEDDEQHA